MFDIIIVGGGMAGLYTGYLLKKYTTLKFLVLEKNQEFGGRARNERFAGETIVTGAGIGRKRKDKLLLSLMKELDISIHEFKVEYFYSPKLSELSKIDIWRYFDLLKHEFYKQNQPLVTFKEFALKVWGKSVYDAFILLNGYTDMENEDIFQTLHYYGMEDNLKRWIGFSVDWKLLVQRMCKYIGSTHLKKNHYVKSIKNFDSQFEIVTNHDSYRCKKVVMATTIDVIQKYLKNYTSVYSLIKGQSFLRTYIQVDSSSAKVLKEHIQGLTKVSNMFQKIIPIQRDKGVYMIAYSDNQKAERGKKLSKSEISKWIRREFEIQEPIRVELLKHYYWKIGTHYFKSLPVKPKAFLKIAQHPEPNVFVVGESVSLNQGWVEGALESVEKIFTYLVDQK